ncbi:metal-dependent hydrolase [bacterium]|nr:metal-dependent hydrolase [bacterium]
MCSPVGHSLAGALVVRHNRFDFKWSSLKALLLFLVIANLPDVDFLFGWAQGDPNLYHQTWTHSLAFIFGVSIVSGLIYSLKGTGQGVQAGRLVFWILAAHLLCDILGTDYRPPIGIPLFWPLTDYPVHSPYTVFGNIIRVPHTEGFFRSLLCWHNFRVVVHEIGVMAGIYLFLLIFRKRG